MTAPQGPASADLREVPRPPLHELPVGIQGFPELRVVQGRRSVRGGSRTLNLAQSVTAK